MNTFNETTGRSLALGALLLLYALTLIAAPAFPALSGRIVDEANLLTAPVQTRLSQLLQQHQQTSGNQVVVVILSTLQGYDIADYGYQLGRHWGIGQAGQDNGVLFIVAPKERKIRIEVGYGLEGTLTDALSKQIIDNEVIPYLKAGNFEQGIESGALAIVATLQGGYESRPAQAKSSRKEPDFGTYFFVVVVFMMVGALVNAVKGPMSSATTVFTGSTLVSGLIAGSVIVGFIVGIIALVIHVGNFASRGGGSSGYSAGGGGWSRGGGGGFSGGGGSFGGGGASGSW